MVGNSYIAHCIFVNAAIYDEVNTFNSVWCNPCLKTSWGGMIVSQC